MKNIYKLALFIPLLVTSCSTDTSESSVSSEETTNYDSSWVEELSIEDNPNTVKLAKNYYQLLVYSFADSNGDGNPRLEINTSLE